MMSSPQSGKQLSMAFGIRFSLYLVLVVYTPTGLDCLIETFINVANSMYLQN